MATPASGNKIEIRGGDETAAEGLLLLPPQIQELTISYCPELSLRADSAGGGGLQGLHSLRSLCIVDCPKFLSSSSGFPFPTSLQDLTLNGVEGMAPLSNLTSLTKLTISDCGDLRDEALLSSSGFPLPTSLQDLTLNGVEGMATLAPLSNLTSLTKLYMRNCGDLRGEDLWPLFTELVVIKTPKFFMGSEPSRPHEQELLCHSSKLQTDDVAGVLAAPVCGILSSSLTSLVFYGNYEVERFTEEQEKALHLLTSLQHLRFWNCDKLQCLPAGLHRLTNLKELQIWGCAAIRSLPKDGLPSSLRVLNSLGNSEELRRQCRKLRGTIPIIRA